MKDIDVLFPDIVNFSNKEKDVGVLFPDIVSFGNVKTRGRYGRRQYFPSSIYNIVNEELGTPVSSVAATPISSVASTPASSTNVSPLPSPRTISTPASSTSSPIPVSSPISPPVHTTTTTHTFVEVPKRNQGLLSRFLFGSNVRSDYEVIANTNHQPEVEVEVATPPSPGNTTSDLGSIVTDVPHSSTTNPIEQPKIETESRYKNMEQFRNDVRSYPYLLIDNNGTITKFRESEIQNVLDSVKQNDPELLTRTSSSSIKDLKSNSIVGNRYTIIHSSKYDQLPTYKVKHFEVPKSSVMQATEKSKRRSIAFQGDMLVETPKTTTPVSRRTRSNQPKQ